MTDLVTWLWAQLDEDERLARATMWNGSNNSAEWELAASATVSTRGDVFSAMDRTVAQHIARHDPARVLAEVDAKRRLVEECAAELQRAGEESPVGSLADFVLRTLALPYAGRPGYRKEWMAP